MHITKIKDMEFKCFGMEVIMQNNIILKKVRNAAVYGLTFGLASGLVFTGVTKLTGSNTSGESKPSTVQMSTTSAALASNVSTKNDA